jgi:hypothetical protein
MQGPALSSGSHFPPFAATICIGGTPLESSIRFGFAPFRMCLAAADPDVPALVHSWFVRSFVPVTFVRISGVDGTEQGGVMVGRVATTTHQQDEVSRR